MTTSLPSTRRLALMGSWRLAFGVLFVAALVFVPAGTLDYWQAWVYLALLFIPVGGVGTYLLLRDPMLMERRMRMRETHSAQRQVILVSSMVMVLILVVPGLDHRFNWSFVPTWAVIAADVAIFLGYALFALTLRENRFASRVVEVETEQAVIHTGPYALVRHPMYLAMSIMFVLSPVALGSWWGLVPSMVFPLTLLGRITNEEQLLRAELSGYEDYCQATRYRLIPFIW